jgi:hypothetical protein
MTFKELFNSMKFVDSAERDKFENMFSFYVSELPENFYLNQFELANKYPGSTYEEWTRFLQHQAFDSWKTKQVNLIASTETDKALAGGLRDKESVNLLKARTEIINTDTEVKPTIIVIPESLFFKEED